MSTFTTDIRKKWNSAGNPPKGTKMTEEDFIAWCDEDVRAEWVDGEVIVMAPANFEHADLQLWLSSILRLFVDRHALGVVVGPEFIVHLPSRHCRRLPDILFVAQNRRDIIRRTHVEGPPDLIVEIVSPDSEARDWREKFLDYEASGVREYWVIDPMSRRVEAYGFGKRKKYTRIKERDGKIASTVVQGWHLRPAWLFQDKRVGVLEVLAELGVR